MVEIGNQVDILNYQTTCKGGRRGEGGEGVIENFVIFVFVINLNMYIMYKNKGRQLFF